jgi:hypothetical protein
MASIPGTVINSRIVPSDSSDNYATHDAQFGRDGWRSVANISERDAIYSSRRVEGMAVWVQNISAGYQLLGGISNSNWTLLSVGSNADITKSEVAAISAGLQSQIDSINLVAGANVSIIENPNNTWTISSVGGGGGNSWLPVAGTGMTITAPTSSSYLFTVSDYIGKTEVAAISSGLQSQLISISGLGIIGPAEDGTYTDGLFVDFINTTPVGTAVDRFNEVLKALAPPPAPALSNISISNTGTAGKLSFGPSNNIAGYTNVPTQDINSTITVGQVISDGGDSVTLRGIFNASTTMSGVLADSVVAGPGSPTAAYPADSFADGNSGLVQLWANGVLIVSADLTSTSSSITVTNASGSLVLSASNPVSFPNGTPFTVFTYRTGTWQLNAAGQRNGYNRIEVRRINGSTTVTNIFGWIVDNSVVATTFAGESLTGLSMAGSKYITGINYHTSGTATYAISASNARRNTYSSSGTAISHTGTRCTIPATSFGSLSNESQVDSILKTATISTGSRILNQNIAASTTIDRVVQSDLTSTGVNNFALLLDATAASSTATVENFDDEVYRIASDLNTLTTAGYTSIGGSPSDWNSTISIVSSSAGYSNGLLIENGLLKYPTQGTNGGDYSTITNGPSNPNYSTATGNRTYYRFFYDASPRQNFRLAFVSTSTSFVSVATGPSINNVTLEVMAPNTTTDGSLLGVWKDATVAYTNDNSIGCFASSNGPTIPTNWGMTLGGKNTATAGNVIVIRLTASSAWTGSIDSITMTWL